MLRPVLSENVLSFGVLVIFICLRIIFIYEQHGSSVVHIL